MRQKFNSLRFCRFRPALAALALILCALTACAPTGDTAVSAPAAASPPPAPGPSEPPQPSPQSPAPAQPQESVLPASAPAPFPEIPLDDYSLSIAVPDFLDADQQLLYRQAHAMYSCMFGGDTSGICLGEEDQFPNLNDLAEQNGITYTKATGRYAAWPDFDAMIHALFTDQFWTRRNSQVFIGIDGALYYLNAARGSYYRNKNFPDTFRLDARTGDEIAFTLTGYYSSPWPAEGESSQQRDQRLRDGWEYTMDFPIRLVRTADGWRFDEFHTTAGDQKGPAELDQR